jgi:large subunit ribosomal protein L13
MNRKYGRLLKKNKRESYARKWYIFDASKFVLGRLATKISIIIRGKHHFYYVPYLDLGDYVIVINARRINLTGKKETNKKYMFYTGYMGNEYYRTVSDIKNRKPEFIIKNAVRGMLPKNKLSKKIIKKLKIFPDQSHNLKGIKNFLAKNSSIN